MAFRDESPIGFDGTGLLPLVRSGRSPFQDVWDVNLLIREIEDHLASVVDIPAVGKGSNNYVRFLFRCPKRFCASTDPARQGFHCMLSDGRSILARLARGDPNALNYDGFPIEALISEAKFELAAYELLKSQPGILASRLLYHRIPVQHPGPRLLIPQDIMGRRLFVFEKANGEKNVWKELRSDAKVSSQGSIFLASANPECVLQSSLLVQCAQSRAALFRFDLPLPFAAAWLRERLFEQKPASLPIAVAPTRDFCVALFTSKIKATIKNLGDMIGWEDDNHMVGPRAAAAKQSILRLIPHILPPEIDGIYRLVLEHGDFGIHNMSIAVSSDGNPRVTSLYDWETGCVVPAFLSDPLMAVSGVDLILDQYGEPAITRVSDEATLEEKKFYMGWAEEYVKVRLPRSDRSTIASGLFLSKANSWLSIICRRSMITRLTTERRFGRGKTLVTSGLRCATGGAMIRKGCLENWGLGPRSE